MLLGCWWEYAPSSFASTSLRSRRICSCRNCACFANVKHAGWRLQIWTHFFDFARHPLLLIQHLTRSAQNKNQHIHVYSVLDGWRGVLVRNEKHNSTKMPACSCGWVAGRLHVGRDTTKSTAMPASVAGGSRSDRMEASETEAATICASPAQKHCAQG